MPSWPGSLPQNIMVDGYSSGVARNKLRTQMDVGPAKQRRRTTANVVEMTGAVMMTKTQVETLRTFHDDDLEAGALPFDWLDPISGASFSMRFVDEPTWEGVGPDILRVHLNLEILP